MKWSKLKQTIESNFADKVKGRVHLFSTRYTKPDSTTGRAWITIDGVQIVNMSTMKSGEIYRCIYHEATPTDCVTHPAVDDLERTPGKLIEEGEFSRFDLHNCCWAYLNMNIEDALQHDSPIINMLAMIDKRLGKRRLSQITTKDLHPLVARLLNFRLEVEGLNKTNDKKNSH